MKQLIFSLAVLFTGLNLHAQVPNASFENWTSGDPDGWVTANSPPYVSVTQSNQPHTGSSAAKLGIYTISNTTVSGILETSYGTSNTNESDSLVFWYKSNFINGDQLSVYLIMYSNGNTVAFGTNFFPANQSSYTRVAVAATPFTVAPIDSVSIEFVLNNPTVPPDANTYVLIDDVRLGSSLSGIDGQQQEETIAVFPNPATALVNFNVTETSTLEIYSAEGKLLVSKNISAGNGQLDLSAFPQGVLLMVLRNEQHIYRQRIIHTL